MGFCTHCWLLWLHTHVDPGLVASVGPGQQAGWWWIQGGGQVRGSRQQVVAEDLLSGPGRNMLSGGGWLPGDLRC